MNAMTTMTMPATVAKAQPIDRNSAGQLTPFLPAIALLVTSAVLSVLISGPMH
jgi:hypothetical protein